MQMRTYPLFLLPAAWKQAMLAILICASLLLPTGLRSTPAATDLNLEKAAALAFVAESDGSSFTTLGMAGALRFQPDMVSLRLPSGLAGADEVQVKFLGTTGTQQMAASRPLAGVVHRYTGSDPAQWQTGLPTYAALTYAGLYPGIDLLYEGQDGRLKGTYLLAAGSTPADIRWQYQGARKVWIEQPNGDLRIETAGGSSLREHAPVAWQHLAGRQVPVKVSFRLESGQVGFALGAYDPSQPLVIDPILVYGTYLGASSTDSIQSVALDADGNVIVTGQTYSANFPGSTGPRNGSTDIFITKLSPQGSALIFTTILGGMDDEDGAGIAAAASGSIWLTGTTESTDFPMLQPLHPADFSDGWQKAFAARLSSSGQLLQSTLLGLQQNNEGRAVALDPQGNAYFTGRSSAQYGPQAYVSKITADGTQQPYLSVFGAAARGFDKGSEGSAIAVDSQGFTYITGRTNSIVFPVQNAYQAACAEDDTIDCVGDDAFLIKINPAGDEIAFSTYLGGGDGGSPTGTGSDEGKAIALDTQGNILVAGETLSPAFPLKNALQAQPGGADNFTDAFLTKFTPDGSALVFSTYLGGQDWEELRGLVVDEADNSYLAGFTSSDTFPVTADALQATIGPGVCIVGSTERYCYDGFLTGVDPDGALITSTFLGGSDDDVIHGLAYRAGAVYIAGKTESHNLPTTAGSYQPTKALNDDGFLIKVQLSGALPNYVLFLPAVQR